VFVTIYLKRLARHWMARVQAKAGTMRFVLSAICQYGSDHHKASDPTGIAVILTLSAPPIIKSPISQA
jgi:hypothetical protein